MAGTRRERTPAAAAAPVGGKGPTAQPWTPAHRAALLLVFAVLGLLAFRQLGSPDLGFHLRTGDYILSGHLPPRTDLFSFTMGDHAYTDTSWGYDILVAAVQKLGGAPGLVVVHALLVLGIFAILLLTMRLGPAGPIPILLGLLLGGLASEMRFETRPELASYLLLGLVLYILHRHAEGLASPLWALPLIHLLWANLHGLFVLGWAALACFAAGLFLRRSTPDRRLLGWSALAVGAALINPYGLRGFFFPLTLMTRLGQENIFARTIGEFVSPFALGLSRRFPFYPWSPIFCFRLLLALSVLALVPLLLQKRFWCLLLWAGSLALAYRMIRNLPIFVVCSLPGIVWGLPVEKLASRLIPGARARRWGGRAVLAGTALAAALLGLRVLNDAYYVASRRTERTGWSWNRLALPVDAAAFADRVGLRGPMLNHLNFGGYLMWARPEPVFIDGRLEVVGEEFYDEYLDALGSAAGLESCVARYGIRWLVFPYATSPELLGRLSRDPNWRLAYRDHLSAIFVRSGPGVGRFIDPALARQPGTALLPLDSLPGFPGRPRSTGLPRWLGGMMRRESFPSDDFNRGLFHIYRGELDMAQEFFARAIERSGGAYYELYSNLGATLYRRRRLDDADLLPDRPRGETGRPARPRAPGAHRSHPGRGSRPGARPLTRPALSSSRDAPRAGGHGRGVRGRGRRRWMPAAVIRDLGPRASST